MSEWSTFNVNSEVRVKLTPLGRIAWVNHATRYDNTPQAKRLAESQVASGVLTEQLWRIMQIFGPHMLMGGEPPFETEILLKTKP